MTTQDRFICVHCGHEVKAPKVTVIGTLAHPGHVEPELDHSCGWWGFKVEAGTKQEVI